MECYRKERKRRGREREEERKRGNTERGKRIVKRKFIDFFFFPSLINDKTLL